MSVARPRGLRTVIRSLYCNMYGHDWDRKIPDPDLADMHAAVSFRDFEIAEYVLSPSGEQEKK